MTPVGLLATTGVASAATCRPGIGQSIYASVGDSPVRIGTVIDYDVEISLTADDCPISDGTVNLTWPDGTTVQTLATGVSLAPGDYEDFDEQALSLPEYTVAAADLNADDEVMATAVTNATATESTNPVVTQPVNVSTPYSVQVFRPETILTESASPTSGRTPLTETYTFKETNDSPDTNPTAQALDAITGSSIVITDSNSGCTPAPVLSGGYNVGDTNVNGLLDVGETWVYTCTVTLTNSTTSAKTFSNSATATGLAQDGLQAGTPASQGDPATEASNVVTVTVTNPSTSLVETVAPASTVRTGTLVTFTYKETNTGSDPLKSVTVTGSFCGSATLASSSDGDTTTLDPGATWTFTCSKTVTNSTSSDVTDTDNATATGTDTADGGAAPTETASASVVVTNPSTSLTETASPSPVPTGTSVTFTYKETNTGSDPLKSVTVTGSFCGAATFVSSSNSVTTALDPGATWTFTCSKTVTNTTSSDLTITDDATANGTDTVDGLAGPTETASTSVVVTNPSTSLVETVGPSSTVRTGTQVTFTYNETNTGSDPLKSVTVTGSYCGAATFASSSNGDVTTLDPGATWTFTCKKTVTDTTTSDFTITDNATATGTDTADGGAAPTETASASVVVTPVPSTSLVETVSASPVRTGTSVTFTYKETNTGSDPLTSVTVTGSFCGPATFVSSSDGDSTDLDPGATWTFTCTKTVTNTTTSDLTVTDDATAAGTDTVDGLAAPTETASAAVVVTPVPSTSLVETVGPAATVRTGTSVTFTYKETNNGPDPLKSVTVTGSFCGAATFASSSNGDTTTLDPGATWTFTCSKTVTDTATSDLVITDDATATGTDTVDGLAAPTETASASVTVTDPTTTLTETVGPASTVRTGTPVTFTYNETNTGSDPMSAVTVTGSFCGAASFVSSSDGDTTTLDPGATWTFTCTKTVTDTTSGPVTVTDNATATGTDTADGTAAPIETASASVTVTNPSTTLTETASPSSVTDGTPVTFTYTETNDGSDPLSGVTVTGSFCGAATFVSSSDGNSTTLDPGASWTFTCTKTVTATVTDTATATGTDTVDGLAAPPETASATVTGMVAKPPKTKLTETASAPVVGNGVAVTFTYTEMNTGTVGITGVSVTGSLCGPATFVSSSDGNTATLDPGATWIFTCTATLSNPTAKIIKVTDIATAVGTSVLTGKPAPTETAKVCVKVKPGPIPCGIVVSAGPNPLVESGGSDVYAVVQVEACPQFAGDTVNISSSQLVSSCTGGVSFGTLQPGHTPANSIQVVIDDDGNVTVSVTGVDCAPGTSTIEASLIEAPYLTALTTLDALPPQVTPVGVTGYPANEVETGDTPASGSSDVYSVFYVETDPVYAEAKAEISSSQLLSRCLGGVLWSSNLGTSPTATATATLDDDGNAVFLFEGASCAAGTSAVDADILAGNHPTYTSTYTLQAPTQTPSV